MSNTGLSSRSAAPAACANASLDARRDPGQGRRALRLLGRRGRQPYRQPAQSRRQPLVVLPMLVVLAQEPPHVRSAVHVWLPLCGGPAYRCVMQRLKNTCQDIPVAAQLPGPSGPGPALRRPHAVECRIAVATAHVPMPSRLL